MTNEIRIMRGPNMWSSTHQHIIAIKYDHQEFAGIDHQKYQQITHYLRTNYQIEHYVQDDGLCLFRYILHLAALFQGSSFYHDLVSPSPEIFFGLLEYQTEEAGIESFKIASEIIGSLAENEIPLSLTEAQQKVHAIHLHHSDGPTTCIITEAARQNNIPVNKGPAGYTFLGYGKKQKIISAAISHDTSCIAVDIACNKDSTKKFLESANLPVPKCLLIRDETELSTIAEQLKYPLITKPLNGNHGRNVTCGINSYGELLEGIRHAAEVSDSVIIEEEISGYDYRLLVIGNKFVAASLRQPAFVIGDGFSSIFELIERENLNPLRGSGHENGTLRLL